MTGRKPRRENKWNYEKEKKRESPLQAEFIVNRDMKVTDQQANGA